MAKFNIKVVKGVTTDSTKDTYRKSMINWVNRNKYVGLEGAYALLTSILAYNDRHNETDIYYRQIKGGLAKRIENIVVTTDWNDDDKGFLACEYIKKIVMNTKFHIEFSDYGANSDTDLWLAVIWLKDLNYVKYEFNEEDLKKADSMVYVEDCWDTTSEGCSYMTKRATKESIKEYMDTIHNENNLICCQDILNEIFTDKWLKEENERIKKIESKNGGLPWCVYDYETFVNKVKPESSGLFNLFNKDNVK